MGAADHTTDHWHDGSLNHLGKTEVGLTLTKKFALETFVDRANAERLFVKTKQLLASVLPCTKETNLIGCLKSASTPEQNELYWQLLEKKMEVDEKAEQNRLNRWLNSIFKDGILCRLKPHTYF